jgi:8-oxo-dGTP diphosphatase
MFKNPKLTVDIIIELVDTPGHIVLIQRKNPPHGLALPGGFVDDGEWVADAAIREAKEETGLDVELTELFHLYSDPGRDPRHHTVSTVFLARASGRPVGGDDAAACITCPADAPPHPLVFDHPLILADYLTYRRLAVRPPPRR